MKKIPTLFTRDAESGLIRNEEEPRASLVFSGRCEATKKLDGTCCLFFGGNLWKRRMVRVERPEGEGDIVQIMILPSDDAIGTKTEAVRPINLPDGFMAASDVIWKDDGTGQVPGWVPVGLGPDDQYHNTALATASAAMQRLSEGKTYELCGPKVQGNPQCLDHHCLIEHGTFRLMNVPTDFDGLKEYLTDFPMEGIVWWLDGSPYAKIKRRDFNLPWPVEG